MVTASTPPSAAQARAAFRMSWRRSAGSGASLAGVGGAERERLATDLERVRHVGERQLRTAPQELGKPSAHLLEPRLRATGPHEELLGARRTRSGLWRRFLEDDVRVRAAEAERAHARAARLVAFRPRIGAYVVALWLWGIIVNLLLIPGFYDVALRDFGLSVGALALARLSQKFNPRPLGV